MKRTRKIEKLNEGVYDFYEQQDGSDTTDKIINYYIDKIRKSGAASLTKKELQIFNDAKRGKLTLDNPVYKRNKLTGDIETDTAGNAIRMDKDQIIPGVPFLTSKGRGIKRKEVVNGRCYWNIDEDCKYYYVFSVGSITEENTSGLIIYKTESKGGGEYGAFIVPKNDLKGCSPEDLWKKINDKYDKGVILDKETYLKFVNFDKLYHESRKANAVELKKLYTQLKNYPD